MAFSLFEEQNPFKYQPADALPNHFRFKRFGNRTLVTTDHGGWAMLDDAEFGRLLKKDFSSDPALFSELARQGIIVTKENADKVVQWNRSRLEYLSQGVTLHIVVPTLRCNHKCVYCHAKSKPMDAVGCDMDEDTARQVVDFVFQAPSPVLQIEFQGGEPLARFDLVQFIAEYAKKKARETGKTAKFNIVTNLSLMDNDILDYFIKNKFGICTSLDGPKEVHDKNRVWTGGSSYETAVRWIDVIKNEKKFRIHALPTVTRHSIGFGKEIADEYNRLKLWPLRLRGLNNAGLASEHWKKIGYSAGEFLEFWKGVTEYCFSLNEQGPAVHEGLSSLIARKMLSKSYQSYTCLGSPCGTALSQAAYTEKGEVYACDEGRSFDIFRIGSVKENSYKEVYSSQAALDLIDLSSGLSSTCDFCVWHPYCGSCLVCTYGSQKQLSSILAQDHECTLRAGMMEYVMRKLSSGGRHAEIMREWSRRMP